MSSAGAAARSHVVVVGAGMGGLAAAITLAGRGSAVTVIERHATPGGKMRQVRVGGRTIDAGPTVFTMRWIFEALFRDAGLSLDDFVVLRAADLLARHGWVGSDSLDLFTDVERSAAAIADFSSPDEADRYRRFAAECEDVFRTLDRRFMRAARPSPLALSLGAGPAGMLALYRTRPFVSLWRWLGRRFHDPRLRQLFARYSTYCGSSPFAAPATLMLIAHVERCGVWQVEGGMHTMAQGMMQAVERLGGEIRFGVGVERLSTRRDRVDGVELENGERIAADAVVYNGDTNALSGGLLGHDVRRAMPAYREPSLSAVTQCRVARVTGFPLAHHTVFFGADYHDEFDSVFRRRTITADPTVYVCAQDRALDRAASSRPDRTASGADKDAGERLLCLVNAPATTLDDATTARAVGDLDAALGRHGLELDDIDPAVTTRPQDFDRLFPATDGALYGRPTHGWFGSFRRPGSISRVGGLYLAGGSVHPGAGIPMASQSGKLAAERLLDDLRL